MNDEKFKKQLKKFLPKALQDLSDGGRLNIIKTTLIKDEKTNLAIRIKPDWNRPIKKGK